jgi:hypothetical protein
MGDNWIDTKDGWVNIDKYTDIFVARTTENKFVIKAQDYATDNPPRALHLGFYETEKEAQDLLDDCMLLAFSKYRTINQCCNNSEIDS